MIAGGAQVTEQQIGMLEELIEADHGLSGRELDFIEDLDHHNRERELTDPQSEWLRVIWARVCNG